MNPRLTDDVFLAHCQPMFSRRQLLELRILNWPWMSRHAGYDPEDDVERVRLPYWVSRILDWVGV